MFEESMNTQMSGDTYIPGIEDFFKCRQNLRSDICLRNQGTINCLSVELW